MMAPESPRSWIAELPYARWTISYSLCMVIRWQSTVQWTIRALHDRSQSIGRLGRDDHAERPCQTCRSVRCALGEPTFERPRPYTSMMRAAQYHDGGWLRYETNPYLDTATGKSPSFQQVPTDTAQLAAYQWAIDMLTDVDSYTGLMVSKHRTGLWQSRYGAITQPPPGPPRKLSGRDRGFHHAQRGTTARHHRRPRSP